MQAADAAMASAAARHRRAVEEASDEVSEDIFDVLEVCQLFLIDCIFFEMGGVSTSMQDLGLQEFRFGGSYSPSCGIRHDDCKVMMIQVTEASQPREIFSGRVGCAYMVSWLPVHVEYMRHAGWLHLDPSMVSTAGIMLVTAWDAPLDPASPLYIVYSVSNGWHEASNLMRQK